MRRFAVLGSRGQLGTWLTRRLGAQAEGLAFDLPELDITDREAVEAALFAAPGGPPEVVLNAAAITDVDGCETDPEAAGRVNADAPQMLAELCARVGVGLLHLSTDYVFDGEGQVPLREEDPPRPQSGYGRSKLAGERAVLAARAEFLVVRTSWLFGPGRNFVGAILAQAERVRRGEVGAAMRVVDDQVSSPTYARDLADGILALLSRGARGLYHLSNADEASWWDFARAALDEAGYAELEIQRIQTGDLARPAARPSYSRLDCSKAAGLGVVLPSWRKALSEYLRSADSPIANAARGHDDTEGIQA